MADSRCSEFGTLRYGPDVHRELSLRPWDVKYIAITPGVVVCIDEIGEANTFCSTAMSEDAVVGLPFIDGLLVVWCGALLDNLWDWA